MSTGRRSDSFELVLLGAAVALMIAFKAIFDIFFEEWIKSQLSDKLGLTVAEMIERFGAIVVPLCISIAVIWLLYRYMKRDFDRQLVVERDSSDEMRSNIYIKMEKLSPEARRELYRVVTAEIETDQLNVGMKMELERVGFIKPAFAYTPAEFIERYRPFIVQWFKRNPL
jgi:hypothetical protein